MPQLSNNGHTVRLFATTGMWGEAGIVVSARGYVLNLTGKNLDTSGSLHRSAALVNISIADAQQLAAALAEAVAAAEDADPRQPALWSEPYLAVRQRDWKAVG